MKFYVPTIGFLLFTLLFSAFGTGCRTGKSLRPITPSQFRSGELGRIGNAALEKGNWAEAEKKLEEAVRLNKKDVELRRHYAETLWIQGKQQESLTQLAEAIRRGGEKDALIQLSLAEKYLCLDDPETALRYAEQAIRLAPKESKAWTLRGKSHFLLAGHLFRSEEKLSTETEGRHRQHILRARNDYYRALSLSPGNRDVMPELAAAQMLCGQPEQALATWQNLQELFPPDSVPTDLLRGKAESYIALSRFSEAIACLEAARNKEPDRLEIQQRLFEVIAMNRTPAMQDIARRPDSLY